MAKCQLVVLMGVDGSGKSSVAAEVQRLLRDDHGIRAEVCWARWQPRLLAPVRWLARVLLLRGTKHVPGVEEPAPVSRMKRSLFSRWRALGVTYLTLALVDYWLQYARRIRRLCAQSEIVLLDRYWYDLVIDAVGGDAHEADLASKLVQGPWGKWFPRPSTLILLDVEPETARHRKRFEHPLEYLVTRRAMYSRLVRTLGGVTLSANGSLAESTRSVADTLMARRSA